MVESQKDWTVFKKQDVRLLSMPIGVSRLTVISSSQNLSKTMTLTSRLSAVVSVAQMSTASVAAGVMCRCPSASAMR